MLQLVGQFLFQSWTKNNLRYFPLLCCDFCHDNVIYFTFVLYFLRNYLGLKLFVCQSKTMQTVLIFFRIWGFWMQSSLASGFDFLTVVLQSCAVGMRPGKANLERTGEIFGGTPVAASTKSCSGWFVYSCLFPEVNQNIQNKRSARVRVKVKSMLSVRDWVRFSGLWAL